MKEKKKLYEDAVKLLEDCNVILKDEPQLKLINIALASVVKNINEVIITGYIGIIPEEERETNKTK